MKICTKCKVEKDLGCFSKRKSGKLGLRSACQDCIKIQKQEYYQRDKSRIKTVRAKYLRSNKQKIKLSKAEYEFKNKERRQAQKKEYSEKNKETIRAQKKIYRDRAENKEKHRVYRIEYNKNNKEKTNKRERDRIKTEPNYRLLRLLRCRVSEALKGKSKSASTIELLGISVEEAKRHLESQFTEGMSWENHGLRGWHIDHIRPCASFDFSDPAQQKACFHYSNLQPLWAKDNREKSDKYEPTTMKNSISCIHHSNIHERLK
jgi:hypothetical protein